MNIGPYSGSWPPTTPTHPLELQTDGSLLDWMDKEFTQPSNIELWISCENNLVDECPLGDRHHFA